LCITSGLSYAVYTLLNKRMVNHAPTATITLAAFSVAVLVALPAAALQADFPGLTVRDLAAVAYTGIVTAGVGYWLFSIALHHIQPATAVSMVQIEPVVAFGLAVLLLGEPASAAALCGLTLVVAGVLGVVRSELSSPGSSGSSDNRSRHE
jgi:DME family drug/metabolite transporter